MKLDELIKIIDAVSESALTGFRYEEDGIKLHLTKKQGKVWAAGGCPEGAAELSEGAKVDGKEVISPLVGTFYAAPSEEAAPYVKVGDTVKKGQTLAIIEAMKLMNEIESEYDGVIEEVLVENGQTVEYGQPLFRIR